MKEKAYRHYFVVGGSAMITLLIGLITTPIITRLVDPEPYGEASMLTTYANIAMTVLTLGLDQSLVRYFYAKDDNDFKRGLVYQCLGLPLAIWLVFSIVYIIGRRTIGFKTVGNINLVFCIYALILILNRYSTLILRLTKDTNLFSILNIAQKITYVVIAILAIKLIQRDYSLWLVLASVLSYGLVTVLAIHSKRAIWKPIHTKTIPMKELLKYGIPMMASGGLMVLFQAIDKISITNFCTYTDVGVYSSAMSLMSIVAVLRNTFTTVWVPSSIEHYEKAPEDRDFYSETNSTITLVMFIFGLSLIFAKDLIVLLLGEKYREASYYLPFLLFQPIMYTISETTIVGVYFKKKSFVTLWIVSISCLANIVGNTLLIPIIGPKGAAVSTGLSYTLFFVLRTVFSNHYYYVDYHLKKFTLITLFSLGFAAYNTFVEFNLFTVVLYIVIISIILVLYRKTAVKLINELIDFLRRKPNA